MQNNRSKQNPPRYIKVYNELLKNIQEGLYSEHDKLPSENELAQQMKVSRMTLRQSLNLLQEDGIIESKKGVGSFIKRAVSKSAEGLEYIGDVLRKCGIAAIDTIDCDYRLEPAALYTDNVFERSVPVLLSVSLAYFYQEEYCAESFSMIPTDIELVKDKDLSDEQTVKELVTKLIYQEGKIAKYSIKVVDRDLIAGKRQKTSRQFILVTEKLFNEQGAAICFTKYHIPIEKAEITLQGFKK